MLAESTVSDIFIVNAMNYTNLIKHNITLTDESHQWPLKTFASADLALGLKIIGRFNGSNFIPSGDCEGNKDKLEFIIHNPPVGSGQTISKFPLYQLEACGSTNVVLDVIEVHRVNRRESPCLNDECIFCSFYEI